MSRPGTADFVEIVLPHLDAAHNLASWLVRDAAMAEDVVQDAVLRAFSYFGTFRGADSRAWFLRIVRNTAYSALTARKRHEAASLDAPDSSGNGLPLQVPDHADDPEMALNGQQRSAALSDALATLPVEWRECLVLRELEELSYKDIAEVTGVPIGTVMSRLWRARQSLMRFWPQGEQQ